MDLEALDVGDERELLAPAGDEVEQAHLPHLPRLCGMPSAFRSCSPLLRCNKAWLHAGE
jgi:hypothetical protein